MTIDLHIHSTASDGTDTPEEILSRAIALGLKAIAITDHDTVDGVARLFGGHTPQGIELLTGVEISSSPPSPFNCSGNFHILGYGIDICNPELHSTLKILQQAREDRNPLMIKKLRDLGMDITHEEVAREAGDGLVGRPHMARLMIQKGYVSSIAEAFDRFLGRDKPAFVDKFRLDCEKALDVIHNAGGISVLAHPVTVNLDNGQTMDTLVETMANMGLNGLETYYTTHTSEDIEHYLCLADKFRLIVTGGSDYHGTLKNNIQMGRGNGSLNVPYELFAKIQEVLRK